MSKEFWFEINGRVLEMEGGGWLHKSISVSHAPELYTYKWLKWYILLPISYSRKDF